MTDEKLRLALPKGWLLKEDRWSIRNYLSCLSCGIYQEGKDTLTYSHGNIHTTVLRPGDIPWELMQGNFDIGITGKDLVLEENPTNSILEEIFDFQCGCVDLDAITTPENEDILKNKPKNGKKIICKSRYPKIATDYLLKRGFNEDDFLVRAVSGNSERHLEEKTADIIIEVVATGDSIRGPNFRILEKILDSSARMYISPKLRSEKNSWKHERIQRIIRDVSYLQNEIRGLCQARFYIAYHPHTSHDAIQCLNENYGNYETACKSFLDGHIVMDSWFDAYKFLLGIKDIRVSRGYLDNLRETLKKMHEERYIGKRWEFGTNKHILGLGNIKLKKGDLEVNSEDLNRLRRQLEYKGNKSQESTELENKDRFLFKAIVFNLQDLYRYCPFSDIPETPFVFDDRSEDTIIFRSHGGIDKFPMCEPLKLRPEHREKAVPFYFKDGKIHEGYSGVDLI